MFYKNILFKSVVFWMGTISLFSGTVIFDEWIVQFYNLFFTTLPNFIFGAFDQ